MAVRSEGDVVASTALVHNHIGDRGCIFPGRGDAEVARKLVQYYSTRSNHSSSSMSFLTDAQARENALKASLSASEVDALCRNTPFVQISNNLLEFFTDPLNRIPTPTRSFVSSRLSLSSGDRLLDAGCSAGRYLLEFSGSGAELIGVDLSMLALQIGSQAWALSQSAPQPTWHAATILRLPIQSASCTHVTSFVVLSYVPIKLVLQEFGRILQSSGVLLFTVEGPGMISEMSEITPLISRRRLGLKRWWLGHKLMEWGLDWQGKNGIGWIAGFTPYSSAMIHRIVSEAGFVVKTVTVLKTYRGTERLLGIEAIKA